MRTHSWTTTAAVGTHLGDAQLPVVELGDNELDVTAGLDALGGQLGDVLVPLVDAVLEGPHPAIVPVRHRSAASRIIQELR